MSTFIGSLTKEEVINLINQMLARNEANDKDRFQLKKINIDNSGYAFGRCQHDCGQREDARNLVAQCLMINNLLFPDIKLINEIKSTLADHTKELSKEQLDLVNEALSSIYCMGFVVAFDNKHIEKILKEVKHRIKHKLKSDVGIRVKEKILSNPKLFLQLVDYHNQFNLSSDGPLIHFLNGEAVDRTDLATGKVASLDTGKIETDLISEIRRFINDYTLYGMKHRSDCERRQHNIDGLPIPAGTSSSSSGNDHLPNRGIPLFPWFEPKPTPHAPAETQPRTSPPAPQPTPAPNTAPTPNRPSRSSTGSHDNSSHGGGGHDAGAGACSGGGRDSAGGACDGGGGRDAGGGACSGGGRDSAGGACDGGGHDSGGHLGILALLDNEATEVLPSDNIDSVSSEDQVSMHSTVRRNSTSDFSTSIPFLAPPKPLETPKPKDDTMTHHMH